LLTQFLPLYIKNSPVVGADALTSDKSFKTETPLSPLNISPLTYIFPLYTVSTSPVDASPNLIPLGKVFSS